MSEILPIGSIVKLKRGAQKLMIICRAPLYNNGGTIGYFDYSACPYPSGQTNQAMLFLNSEDIEQVFFEGYRDEEEKQFCELYEKIIKKVEYPKLQLQFEEQ